MNVVKKTISLCSCRIQTLRKGYIFLLCGTYKFYCTRFYFLSPKNLLSMFLRCYKLHVHFFMHVIIQSTCADFKQNCLDCDKSMKFGIVVEYVLENIFTNGASVKVEIGERGSPYNLILPLHICIGNCVHLNVSLLLVMRLLQKGFHIVQSFRNTQYIYHL